MQIKSTNHWLLKGFLKSLWYDKMECVHNLISFVCRAAYVNNSQLFFRAIFTDRSPDGRIARIAKQNFIINNLISRS
ncbi:MAG TPA: hypothetical protein DCX51_02550 [Halomonas sp.]|jgi:hypothetical protein|nr:hypothetical protein [Halomonas sp.]HAY15831.1 hypothetical protein [Halomonas sp.]